MIVTMWSTAAMVVDDDGDDNDLAHAQEFHRKVTPHPEAVGGALAAEGKVFPVATAKVTDDGSGGARLNELGYFGPGLITGGDGVLVVTWWWWHVGECRR
jgi:hypothetical protein